LSHNLELSLVLSLADREFDALLLVAEYTWVFVLFEPTLGDVELSEGDIHDLGWVNKSGALKIAASVPIEPLLSHLVKTLHTHHLQRDLNTSR